MKQELPHLRKLVVPALATLTRKTRIGANGISIEQAFRQVKVERQKLESYRAYFGFKDELPLPYLYLMAQRAQGVLMLNEAYTIPIPGTIHLSNHLEVFKELDPEVPFDLETSLKVDFEEEGALKPTISVVFNQGGAQVAHCESGYLVKRKTSRKPDNTKTKRVPEVYTGAVESLNDWKLTKAISREYASLSDDHNPIHKSIIAARVVGFKKPIAHGWYIVSRALAEGVEYLSGVSVQFKKPLFVPGQYLFIKEIGLKGGITLTICDETMVVLARLEVS